MSDLISGLDNMSVTEGKSGGNDAARIAEGVANYVAF